MSRSFWRSVVCCGLFALAMVLSPLQATAQQTLGSLNGTVVDPSGAAIGGATVSVTNTAVNTTETTTTQKTGSFQIFNLQIGVYSIKVSHDGFETTTIPAVTVQEARATTMNVTLKVGNASESIEVVANPLLNATDVTNGYTLDQAQIQLTPLATGSFTQLAVLSPGVSAELLANLDTNAGLGNQNICGQRTARHFQYVSGEWRRCYQPVQRHEFERRRFAALQLRRRRDSYGRRRVWDGNVGLRVQRQQPAFASAGVHAGTSREHLDVRRAAGRYRRCADRCEHDDRNEQAPRPGLRYVCQQFSECRSVLLQAGSASDFTAGNWCISRCSWRIRRCTAGPPAGRSAARSSRTSSSSSLPISTGTTRIRRRACRN